MATDLFDCPACAAPEPAGQSHIVILCDDMQPSDTPVKICSTYGQDSMIEILAEIVRQHRETGCADA